MNFVPDQGVGRHDSNSYVDIDFARDYGAERHRPALQALTDEQLQAVLVRATDYIDNRWAQAFIGSRSTSTQALSWPRSYAYDDRGILIIGLPPQLQKATVEMAERAISLDRLVPDPPSPFPIADADGVVAEVTSGQVVSTRKKVGDLEIATTYSGSIGGVTQPVTSTYVGGVAAQEFPEVVLLLKPLVRGGSGSTSFIRY